MRETAIRWVSTARGVGEKDESGDGLDGLAAFLESFGYDIQDLKRMDWLAAAVLVECGCGLREYVERFDGDLARELQAADADAKAAMHGGLPTDASFRHDIRFCGYRPAL